MNTFGKKGIGNESTYSMGFRFSQYLSQRFGLDVLRKITKSESCVASRDHQTRGCSGKEVEKFWRFEGAAQSLATTFPFPIPFPTSFATPSRRCQYLNCLPSYKNIHTNSEMQCNVDQYTVSEQCWQRLSVFAERQASVRSEH